MSEPRPSSETTDGSAQHAPTEDDREFSVAVVDDADSFRVSLLLGLRHCPGVTVVGAASSAEEALDSLEEWRPDVVLMDIRMPGMGGIEATRHVRRVYPHIRVILLSAFGDEELIKRGSEAGADAYLVKGCPLEEISAAIHGRPVAPTPTDQSPLAEARP